MARNNGNTENTEHPMKWFVVHTLTGHEGKVKKILNKLIKENGLEDSFGRIIIPIENQVRIRKGKKIIEEKRLYPGYIVIEMDESDENLRLVNGISGVTHFLGSKTKPIPIGDEEVKALLEQVEESKEKVITKIPFTKGERVTVIDGPFTDFIGTVEDVFPEREKVKVLVVIFGRTTPIELGFHQLKSM